MLIKTLFSCISCLTVTVFLWEKVLTSDLCFGKKGSRRTTCRTCTSGRRSACCCCRPSALVSASSGWCFATKTSECTTQNLKNNWIHSATDKGAAGLHSHRRKGQIHQLVAIKGGIKMRSGTKFNLRWMGVRNTIGWHEYTDSNNCDSFKNKNLDLCLGLSFIYRRPFQLRWELARIRK